MLSWDGSSLGSFTPEKVVEEEGEVTLTLDKGENINCILAKLNKKSLFFNSFAEMFSIEPLKVHSLRVNRKTIYILKKEKVEEKLLLQLEKENSPLIRNTDFKAEVRKVILFHEVLGIPNRTGMILVRIRPDGSYTVRSAFHKKSNKGQKKAHLYDRYFGMHDFASALKECVEIEGLETTLNTIREQYPSYSIEISRIRNFLIKTLL